MLGQVASVGTSWRGRINCRCRGTGRQQHKGRGHPPRLNMAIPSPASDRMEMDFATIVGMEMCHLRSMNKTRSLAAIEDKIAVTECSSDSDDD